jgi:hypothetical protein
MFGFREIVAADFEFSAPAGERPKPVCLVAQELVSGRKVRLFEDCETVPHHHTRSTATLSSWPSSAAPNSHAILF